MTEPQPVLAPSRPLVHMLVGGGVAAAAYLVAGLLPSADPVAGCRLLAAAAVGVLLFAHVHLVDRFRAGEQPGGRLPAWYVRLLLYSVITGETGAAYLLGHTAFWFWFVALLWSWLLYRRFFSSGLVGRIPALGRYARFALHVLLVLVGLAARLS